DTAPCSRALPQRSTCQCTSSKAKQPVLTLLRRVKVLFDRSARDRGDDRVATRGVTATDEHMGAPIGQREGGGFADAAVAPVIRAVVHARSVVLMRSLFWIFEVFTRPGFRSCG